MPCHQSLTFYMRVCSSCCYSQVLWLYRNFTKVILLVVGEMNVFKWQLKRQWNMHFFVDIASLHFDKIIKNRCVLYCDVSCVTLKFYSFNPFTYTYSFNACENISSFSVSHKTSTTSDFRFVLYVDMKIAARKMHTVEWLQLLELTCRLFLSLSLLCDFNFSIALACAFHNLFW